MSGFCHNEILTSKPIFFLELETPSPTLTSLNLTPNQSPITCHDDALSF